MPLEFTRISADRLRELPPEKTVFFFPVGPLEDHGPHLPMGLDILEAEHLCCMAAEKLEHDLPGWVGVIMPMAPLGVNSNTTDIAITVRAHVLRDWLVDACRSLMRSDFKHFVCFSGNIGPRQLTAIEEAGKSIRSQGPFTMLASLLGPNRGASRPSLVSVQSASISPAEVSRSPLWPDPIEHGAKRDTSVALALGVLTKKSASDLYELRPTWERPASLFARTLARLNRTALGFWGKSAVTDASAAWGQSTLQGSVDEVFPKLRAVWEGGNPNFLFRSYYSILPPNKSFFKAWLLAMVVVALITALFYLNITQI